LEEGFGEGFGEGLKEGAADGEMGALVGWSVGSESGLGVGCGVGPVLIAKHESVGTRILRGATLLLTLLGTTLAMPSIFIVRLKVSIHAPALTP
jgi:hypothetical protein